MNIIEAMLSLLLLVSIVPAFVLIDHSIDDSVYRLKIGEDIWRVLYLKGDFTGFDKEKINSDLEEIYKLSNLCVAFEEEDVASCIPSEELIVLEKYSIVQGEVKKITMAVGNQ